MKIYFHKHFFHQQELPLNKRRGFWGAWFKFFKVLFYGTFGFCYLVGKWVITAFIKVWESAQNQIRLTGASMKRRFALARSGDFVRNHASLVLGAICLVLMLSGFKLFAEGIEVKTQVLGWFTRGQDELKNAGGYLAGQDLEAASQKFSQALKNFYSAKEEINKTNTGLQALISLLPQGADGQKVIDASALLSRSGGQIISFYSSLRNLKLTAEGLSSSEENTQIIKQSQETLLLAVGNLKKASDLLTEVNANNVPQKDRAEFIQVSSQVSLLSQNLVNISEIYGLFSSAILKSQNILLVLENNNELRPGGGFIGSFAAIKQDAGKMSYMRLGSIYDLDGQLKEKIMPPLPILAVNNQWFMRDSNWFADFSESANKISQFYEKEGGETPDLVIAVTPNLVVDLLRLTGPVEMPQYQITITAENFVEVTQALTTMSDSTPENKPKQFLADLMPVLLQRLGATKFEELDKLLGIVFDNLQSKHIVFYSRWPEVQGQIEQFNWGGRVRQTPRDYLALNSANLGGTKTDLFISQSADLKTTIDPNGKIKNELVVNYTNTLPDLDYLHNLRFIRIMVPKGSKLISNFGFDYKKMEAPDLKGYKLDTDAREWESSAVKDIISGTLIGEEAGYTFFGNWLSLKPGETRTVKLVYELPFSLNDLDNYSLLLQKQPGAQTYSFSHKVDLSGWNALWASAGTEMQNSGEINYKTQLDRDRFWGAVLKR
jgi:hypothetical protein